MIIVKYVTGYLLSLILTLTAYSLVVYGSTSPWIVTALVVLAIVQMIIQLIFFLHLGDEVKPRYKLISFSFMAVILVIIVVGSLWIMQHMDYNMMRMTPNEKTDYMKTQHDKGF